MTNKTGEENRPRPEDLRFLRLLAEEYPTIQAVCTEIIDLNALLYLPKGTEHFMSDLHGEAEAFSHILNNCSGVIREKVDRIFGHSMPEKERAWFSTLIYYPHEKIDEVRRETENMEDWYSITLYRLVEICREMGSKYTRSKVREALPPAFEHVIDELLHTDAGENNKQEYYQHIISSIIEVRQADEFIVALATLIKRLAVDRLHIVGDIYDRGNRADRILDQLMAHHRVDIQWGNHDILWMGAAAGSEACIMNVLNLALQYNTLDIVEKGYGISLRDMIAFAQETYKDCTWFMPRNPDDKDYLKSSMETLSKVHKAVAILQFKLEGQLIARHPEYHMEDRRLLHRIDFEKNVILLDGKEYPLNDGHFPTIDPADPYRLTVAEEQLTAALKRAFRHSLRLQQHVGFLYSNGSMYTCYNGNLLFHGCIPLDEKGEFLAYEVDGQAYRGKAYMDYAEAMARRAFYAPRAERQAEEDFMWYLWCGRNSPLFGRDKISTFEKYFIADKETWTETKNAYYRFIQTKETCDKILEEFGLHSPESHIINGHIPVRAKKGESPVKAQGRLLVIDGGFCKAYHDTTGIAGYTLIYNSYGLKLVSHESFAGIRSAIEQNKDILTTTDMFEPSQSRRIVQDTDAGREILARIADLKDLLTAYRQGWITPQ